MAGRDERAPIQIDAQQMNKNPLWNHVVLLERAGTGGNARWRCKYCVIYYYCVCLFGTMISVIYDLRDYYVCLFGTKF